jgi:hypothetical protein
MNDFVVSRDHDDPVGNSFQNPRHTLSNKYPYTQNPLAALRVKLARAFWYLNEKEQFDFNP